MRELKIGEKVRVYGVVPGVPKEHQNVCHKRVGIVVGFREDTIEQVGVKFGGEVWAFHRRQCVPLRKRKPTELTREKLARAWDIAVAGRSALDIAGLSDSFESFATQLGLKKPELKRAAGRG